MERLYIVITGRQNSGKSSLINALTGQSVAIVSEVAGTTTDPVKKGFEVPGYASVVLVDTAGTDDLNALGPLRVKKTFDAIAQADVAILVFTNNRFEEPERELATRFISNNIPFLIVHNKSDATPLSSSLKGCLERDYGVPVIDVSTRNEKDGEKVFDVLKGIKPPQAHSLLEGLVKPGNIVLLVAPIDSEAPNGRLILPQVQTIRSVLDNRCTCIVMQPEEINEFMVRTTIRPDLVITDSQVFKKVAMLFGEDIPLTSFSIIMAHFKGYFEQYTKGTPCIENLKDGDRILILESCSHHSSCEDIGRVKIPLLLGKSGKRLLFDFVSGLSPIERAPGEYALVVQCGGCMVTNKQLRVRLEPFIAAGIPVSNYGMVIAWKQCIFPRAIRPFNL